MSETLAAARARLRAKVDAIPGRRGWTKRAAARRFYDVAEELMAIPGKTEDEAVNMLEGLYVAAAEEFRA